MRLLISLAILVCSFNAHGDLCGGNGSCQTQVRHWSLALVAWKHRGPVQLWSWTRARIQAVQDRLVARQMATIHDAVHMGLVKLGLIKTLSPYDHLIRRYSKRHAFDWTLIAAQIYQESRFNPEAKSHAGARGLMQLMPATAKQLGIQQDLHHPETSIRAGVQYMAWLKRRFVHLPKSERKWFILAAYNAGIGHIRDAQRLAKRLGLRSNKWFGHVEKALLLLAKPQYARRARYGWLRAKEPVNYVRSIRRYYRRYAAESRA